MGDKKDQKVLKALAPLLGDKEEAKKQWKGLRENAENFYDQWRKFQETAYEARKETWNRIFPQLLDMQDKIASVLPQEIPTVLGSVNTKELADKLREFQETANQYAVEQADTAAEFYRKGQDQVKEAVVGTVKSIEDKMG